MTDTETHVQLPLDGTGKKIRAVQRSDERYEEVTIINSKDGWQGLANLTDHSLKIYDADINFDETTRLIRYKGKLYTVFAPLGQIYSFDGKIWTKAYDIGEEQGRITIDDTDVYSKWAFSCWALKHCTLDDKLYFGGIHYTDAGNKAAILRYNNSAWEFLDVSSDIGTVEILEIEEFGDYLYAGINNGKIYRSSDGENWSKVFDGVAGYTLIHALSADKLHSGNKIRAGLSTYEKGNMVESADGKIYVSSDGSSWSEDLDLPNTGGVVSLVTWGTSRVLCGTNMGYLYLWDGGYQSWRKIGNTGLPIMQIRYGGAHYSDYDALLACGQRQGLGAIWRLCGARLIKILSSYSFAVSSVERFGADLYYSWNWAEIPAKTYIRGVYGGVRRLSERLLDPSEGKYEPFLESSSATTTNSFVSMMRFNLGIWKNKMLWLKNTGGSNGLIYQTYGSFNGRDYYYLGQATVAAGATDEVDYSTSPYAVINLEVKSQTTDQSTTVIADISCW